MKCSFGRQLGGGRDHGVAGVASSTESISCGADFDSGVAIRGGHLSRQGIADDLIPYDRHGEHQGVGGKEKLADALRSKEFATALFVAECVRCRVDRVARRDSRENWLQS